MTQEERDLALDEMAPSVAAQVRGILRERDEARDVARQLLRIARARGPEPFGLTMAMWLFDEEEPDGSTSE